MVAMDSIDMREQGPKDIHYLPEVGAFTFSDKL